MVTHLLHSNHSNKSTSVCNIGMMQTKKWKYGMCLEQWRPFDKLEWWRINLTIVKIDWLIE